MESGSLVKAFAVLETLADTEQEIALAPLATVAGVSKPTAHRLLQSLIQLGYAERGGPGAYRLTAKLRRLSLQHDDRLLVSAADKTLQALYEHTHETINLGVLRRDRVIYLSVLESRHALRRVQTSDSDPFYCTALGRAIVSFETPARRAMLLRQVKPRPLTAKTITNPSRIAAILDQARREGFAIERDQTDLGVTCIGAPILVNGDAVAAISISAPTVRIDLALERHWIRLICSAAARIASAVARSRRQSA